MALHRTKKSHNKLYTKKSKRDREGRPDLVLRYIWSGHSRSSRAASRRRACSRGETGSTRSSCSLSRPCSAPSRSS